MLLAILLGSLGQLGPFEAGQQWNGTWSGIAAARPDSGLQVGLRLRILTSGDTVRVGLTLPESRLVGLELPSPYSDSSFATIQKGVLHVEFTPDIGLAVIGGLVARDSERIVFEGRLDDRFPNRLNGQITITRYSSPIVLRRLLPGSQFEAPVTFMNPNDSLRLGGTLILPHTSTHPPVVVFVTGSDPDTRDAWRYEATVLADHGVASLLYDKRGVGESSGASHDLASWDDLAGDVEGAITYLAHRPDLVDTTRIGLIGQSQGTWIIAKVASRDRRVKYMVSVAGSGISAAEQETYRTGALMHAAGFADSDVAHAVAFQRQKFAVARTGLGWERLDSMMRRLRADSVRWFPGYGTGAATRSLAVLRLYGVLQFNYDPIADLEQIVAPTLVIMGEKDLNFPPSVVVEHMQRALNHAGNRCVNSRIIPNATHGLLVTQSYHGRFFRRVISEDFLNVLTTWVPTTVSCTNR